MKAFILFATLVILSNLALGIYQFSIGHYGCMAGHLSAAIAIGAVMFLANELWREKYR